MQHALTCDGLHKTFVKSVIPLKSLQERLLHMRRHRERMQIRAVDGVSLQLAPGEWIGLVGPNGCGKTTLLKLLAGLIPADAGTVSRCGTMACFLELGAGFHPERSADENLKLFAMLHRVPSARVGSFIEEVIAFAGIASHRRLPVKCYSTGMQLRLGYAAVAHIEADTYLLDEILAVGDEAFMQKCHAHLRAMKADGKSVIVASPVFERVDTFCDRIFMMRDGRIESVLTPSSAMR